MQPKSLITSIGPFYEVGYWDTIPGIYITPDRVASAYNIPPGTGAGVKVGIISFGGGYSPSDITRGLSRIGLPTPKINTVLLDGATGTFTGNINGADTENNLDIFCVAGVAPEAEITIYFCGGFRLDTYINRAVADGCKVISISWGLPDYDTEFSDPTYGPSNLSFFQGWDSAFESARNQGVIVLAASGDYGSVIRPGRSGVSYPASSSYVVAVGGKVLTVNTSTGAKISETIWPDSGGGFSSFSPRPSWQTGLTYQTYNTITNVVGLPTAIGPYRGLPDLAAPAYNYLLPFNGVTYLVGGTSAACPVTAGIIARLIEYHGSVPDNILSTLYANPGAFFDLTMGNDAVSTSTGYVATTGWDPITGLGSPDGPALFGLFSPAPTVDLGTHRSNSNVVVLTVDPSQATTSTTTYSTATILPPDLKIDPLSGVIHGYLNTQTEYLKKYDISINKTRHYPGTTVVTTNTFIMGVKGGDRDSISWITPNVLPNLNIGVPSSISIMATHTETSQNLQYHLVSMGFPGELSLSTTGDIIGTPVTTGTYHFAVSASTSSYYTWLPDAVFPYPYSHRSFQLTVANTELAYTNIYLKPFLSPTKRQQYQDFITNTSTFIPSLIYRPEDPNFGVQTDMKMALEYGIEQLTLRQYSAALTENFSPRRFRLSTPYAIVATDSNNNPLYEAVCLAVIDDLEGAYPERTVSGITVYPATISNMRARLQNISAPNAPDFTPRFLYVNNQPQYQPVIVLCYARVGEGGRIVRNILKTGFDFNSIDFEIDRIIVESSQDNPQPSYLDFPRPFKFLR